MLFRNRLEPTIKDSSGSASSSKSTQDGPEFTTLLALTIALFTTVVYCKAVFYNFVLWDDNIHVFQNAFYQHISDKTLLHFWQRPYESLYIPVSYMAFAGLCLIGRTSGPNPAAPGLETCFNPHVFHTANIVLHGINAVLAFLLIRKITKSDIPSAFGALLFAVHPLQVESVAWISELRGLLSGTLGLSSVLIYLSINSVRNRSFGFDYLSAILLFVLAMLAKPSAVVIPLFILVWQTLYLAIEDKWWVLIRLLPWFILSCADVVITHSVQPLHHVTSLPITQRAVVAIDSCGFYIGKILWPFRLANEYGRSPHRILADRWEIFTIPVFILLCLACRYFGRGRKWVWPSFLTFIVFLMPVSGFLPFAYQSLSTVADRYMYLAMLGPSFALAFVLCEIREPVVKRVAKLSAAVVVALCVVRTESQLAVWTNTHTLFSNAILVNPYDWLLHDRLGYDYMLRGQYADAEREYKFVIEQGVVAPDYFVYVGKAEQFQGRYREAISEFNLALKTKPDFAFALFDRAECEASLGLLATAIVDYREAAFLQPSLTNVDFELGTALLQSRSYEQAAVEFNRSIALYPDLLPAYDGLALSYSKMGEPQLAKHVAQLALAKDPNDTIALAILSQKQMTQTSRIASRNLDAVVRDNRIRRLAAA